MKLLLTGTNGFVGRFLCSELCDLQHEIVAVARTPILINQGVKPFIIDALSTKIDWYPALQEVETVVHLAARVHVMHETVVDVLAAFRKVNVDATLHLASQAAKAGVKRFIFISSVKVNGEFTLIDKPFTELETANPQDPYGISKHEAEQGLLLIAQQTGMEVVIIRPPLVYGAGVKANFASMMRVVKQGIPLPFGAIRNKRSFVYVENLVSFILLCIDHPAAANQTFLVSDGQDISTTELLSECAYALGVKARLLPVPQKLVEVCATIIGKGDVAQRLCGNLQVDISKARTLLGWAPPISVADGLKATALG